MKASHASDIRRCVEKILLGAFAIETDRNEVTLVLLHHQFKVVVREIVLPLESGVLINEGTISNHRDINGRYTSKDGKTLGTHDEVNIMKTHLEHAVDQFRDVIIREARGTGYFYERPQHLRQLFLVDHAVAILIAHVKDDSQLVLGFAAREQQDRVQEFLEIESLFVDDRRTRTDLCYGDETKW